VLNDGLNIGLIISI